MKKSYGWLVYVFFGTLLFTGCDDVETEDPLKVVDIDGNEYNTVIIGGQEWMAENLRTATYRNGEAIIHLEPNHAWSSAGSTQAGGWAHYQNNDDLENTYGKLYNWYAVNDPRKICPEGWHVPSDAEWTILTDFLDGLDEAGGKMKSTGTGHWKSPNVEASNQSGFNGRPGGYRNFNGEFVFLTTYGYWWSSTVKDASYSWGRYLHHNDKKVGRNGSFKTNGLSVRCVKG